MVRTGLGLLVAAMVLTGCATVRDSRMNPFNWFGSSMPAPVAAADDRNPLIPARRASILRDSDEAPYAGSPVAEIETLVLERRPGGAILRVSGIADRQGPFDVRITRENEDAADGTLVYALRALKQPGPQGGSASRRVTAALFLTDQDLAGIDEIRVTGLRSARSVRR